MTPTSWQRLEEAEKALPQAPGELTLLRADLLAAEGRSDRARQFLEDGIRRDPKWISYRIALARLLLNQAQDPPAAARAALNVLDQAERDVGHAPALTATRIQALARMGTSEARQGIHKIADELPSVPGQDQPMLIKDLATALLALGDRERSVQLMSQLASRQPEDLPTQMSMFDLAIFFRSACRSVRVALVSIYPSAAPQDREFLIIINRCSIRTQSVSSNGSLSHGVCPSLFVPCASSSFKHVSCKQFI
jgi:tetratricopeptide (TPR) repeat protein